MNWLGLVLALIPKVLDIMRSVQDHLPEKGAGVVRREIVKSAIEASSSNETVNKQLMAFVDKTAPVLFPVGK